MLSLSLSILGRRAAIVAGAVATISTVACSDGATAPRPPIAAIPPSGPQADIIPMKSLVTVKIQTIWGTLLPETALVKFFAANDSVVILDNSADDKNMTVGIVTVWQPPSNKYSACLVQDTKTYAVDASVYNCKSAPGGQKATDLGVLVMRRFPIVGAFQQDMNGNNIVGGKFIFTAPPSDGFTATAADGSANDLSAANDGKIVIRANRPGTYTWCELTPPTGFLLANPNCGTVNLGWDVDTGFIVKHQRIAIRLPG